MDKSQIDNIEILELDLAHLIKKGYKKNISGNEYIYDRQIPNTPIMLKISSTIRVDKRRKPNKNSYRIRVHAVKVNKEGKICGGFVNAVTVCRTENWRLDLEEAKLDVAQLALVVASKSRLISFDVYNYYIGMIEREREIHTEHKK